VHFEPARLAPFNTGDEAVFGLRFEDFCAVLTVSTAPLALIALDEDLLTGLSHADPVVLALEHEHLERLRSADLSVKEFDGFFGGQPSQVAWENLGPLGRELGVGPEEVLAWMMARAQAASPAMTALARGEMPAALSQDAHEALGMASPAVQEPRAVCAPLAAQPVQMVDEVVAFAPAPAAAPAAAPQPAPTREAPAWKRRMHGRSAHPNGNGTKRN